jgi:large subunit ribosomal protein LP2
MRYIGAYLLAVLGGNANPDAAAIKAILAAQDVAVDAAVLDKLIGELKGKNVEELIAAGKSKLASVAVAAAPAATSAAPVAAAAPAAETKEEKKKNDDDDDAGGMSLDLFGDDGY